MPWRGLASTKRPVQRGLFGAVALLLGVTASLAACGGHTTTVATSNGTAKISSSNNGKNSSVEVKSSNGSAQISTGPGLPSGFPKHIPLPSGATLTGSVSSTSKGKSVFELSYRLGGSLKAGLQRYDAELKTAGWTLHVSDESAGSNLQEWSSSTWDLVVTGLAASSTSSGKPGLDLDITPRASTATT